MLRLAAYLATVFTSSGREFEVGVGREMEEIFFSNMLLTESMFFFIILVRGGPGNLEGDTSPEAINLLRKLMW